MGWLGGGWEGVEEDCLCLNRGPEEASEDTGGCRRK